MSLFDKREIECISGEDGFNAVYPEEDVKQSTKVLTSFCKLHKGTLINADTFLKIIKEEFGKELSQ